MLCTELVPHPVPRAPARLSGHGVSGTAAERAGMVLGMAHAADLDSSFGLHPSITTSLSELLHT